MYIIRNYTGNYSPRIQHMEERISGIEDTLGEIDSSIKENVNTPITNIKYPGNTGHWEKSKPKNNRYRRRWKKQSKCKKQIQQNHRRKLSQPKERHANESTRRLQHTK